MTYVGARSLLSPEDGLALGRGWWWQPKVDGCYAELVTDAAGVVAAARSRSGRELRTDLVGCIAGPRSAVLVGELEAHTEAGIRAAATRGWSVCHLFDVLAVDGLSLADAPYSSRLAALHHFQAAAEVDIRRAASRDRRGNLHSDATGRFASSTPTDTRRFPVVETARTPDAAAELWRSYVNVGGGEGLVAVRADARAGARSAKRKIKRVDTFTARVVSVRERSCVLEYGGQLFAADNPAFRLVAGLLVDVTSHGWYETGATPRFPVVQRVRVDL
jgi:hypothetical protein